MSEVHVCYEKQLVTLFLCTVEPVLMSSLVDKCGFDTEKMKHYVLHHCSSDLALRRILNKVYMEEGDLMDSKLSTISSANMQGS